MWNSCDNFQYEYNLRYIAVVRKLLMIFHGIALAELSVQAAFAFLLQ